MAELESSSVGDNTLKVLTLAGPFFASALAVTYDVGFFAGIGIGFFSFFSLSEHLVFALQSLPFVMVPVAIILVWFSSGWFGYRMGYRDGMASAKGDDHELSKLGSLLRRVGMKEPSPWLTWLITGIMWLTGIVEAWAGQYALAFMLGALPIIISKSRELLEAWKSRSPTLIATCAVAALILSFLIGLQRAHSVLSSQNPSEMIGVDNKSLAAQLIRGGDKGILFFSLENKKVRFLRWTQSSISRRYRDTQY
ncbi:hypothetical protein ACVWYH_002423 [Bradyrhizobium sp. GM24.11]